METFKINDKKQTKMIAHRGLSGIERENTVNAFVAACNRSYYGAECDIHVTTDGKYLVYHDDKTGRLCDKDLIMEQNDFKTLRALRLKEKGAEDYSEILKIPTLEEYLSVLERYQKTAVIELKNAMEEEHIREIIAICRRKYTLEKIIFISFDFDNLIKVRKFAPQQNVQFLTWEPSDDLPDRLQAHKFDLDIGHPSLTEEYIARLHSMGISINCWTCDDRERAKQLIDWGVDFITTNILE